MSRVKDIAVKCFRDEAQAILDLIPQLDEHFDAAVDLMLRCQVREHRLFSSIRWMSSMAIWG